MTEGDRTGVGVGEPDRGADLRLALETVTAAGRVVMETFGTDPEVHHKSPDQPVTEADLAADALLKERLLGARPEDGWLSEESADRPERLERRRVWIVDPIDGTRSFIAGYREFGISVALAEAGEAVVGVIFNPARDHMVWATAGGGAFGLERWTELGDDVDRALAAATPLDAGAGSGDTLLASRSERKAGEFEAFEADWTIRELGSTAWKMAACAMGRGAFISRGPKSEWDVAAGALIVPEAGGVATDLRGRAFRFNRPDPSVYGVAVGVPAEHARLLERARGIAAPRLDATVNQEDEG